MAAIEIVRLDLDATGLRRAAGRSCDAAAARRMLALALVLEGRSRGEAARHEQQDQARAPLLAQYCRRDPRGLARTGRGDQQRARPIAKPGKQVR